MKSCDRGEALVELADRFVNIIKELTSEVNHLKQRIELLENPNPVVIEIDNSIHKLQDVSKEIKCGMTRK